MIFGILANTILENIAHLLPAKTSPSSFPPLPLHLGNRHDSLACVRTRLPASPLPSTLTPLQGFKRQPTLSRFLGPVQDSQEQGAAAAAETTRHGSGKAAPPHSRLWRHGDNSDGQSRLDVSFRCGIESSHQLPPTFEVRAPATRVYRALRLTTRAGTRCRGSRLDQTPSRCHVQSPSADRVCFPPCLSTHATVHTDMLLIADYMRSDWSQDHIST